jgi:predicted AAA+ superfamily ATPase
MPEVLNEFIASEDLVKCNAIFDNLLTAYLDDVEKYAASKTEQQVIRHCIRSVFYEANNRITFQGFGKSNYRSREIGEALRALEKAMIIHLVYPNTEVKPPLLPNHKRKPRLQIFDTGLMNYYAQLQRGIIGSSDISDAYQGKVIEHVVGQEMLSTIDNATRGLHFWVRDKKGSSAEVDFIMQVEDHVVPIEVKSGKAGKLKSLHQYMEVSDSPLAVRLYADEMSTIQTKTPSGKTFTLLSLPYFLGSKLEGYVRWWSGKS